MTVRVYLGVFFFYHMLISRSLLEWVAEIKKKIHFNDNKK